MIFTHISPEIKTKVPKIQLSMTLDEFTFLFDATTCFEQECNFDDFDKSMRKQMLEIAETLEIDDSIEAVKSARLLKQ